MSRTGGTGGGGRKSKNEVRMKGKGGREKSARTISHLLFMPANVKKNKAAGQRDTCPLPLDIVTYGQVAHTNKT